MTTEASRYRECLAALQRATGNRVSRLEWDLSDMRRPLVIAMASDAETERWLAQMGAAGLRAVFESHGVKTTGPKEEPIEKEDAP